MTQCCISNPVSHWHIPCTNVAIWELPPAPASEETLPPTPRNRGRPSLLPAVLSALSSIICVAFFLNYMFEFFLFLQYNSLHLACILSTIPPQWGRSVFLWLSREGSSARTDKAQQPFVSRYNCITLLCSNTQHNKLQSLSESVSFYTAVFHPVQSPTHINRAALVRLNKPWKWLSWPDIT